MADPITTEEAIAALGGPLTPETDTPPTDTPPADNPPIDNPPADNPPADNPPTDTPPADDKSPEQSLELDKSQQAFIHMRQQNANLTKMLKGIGSVLDLTDTDINDENKLIAALQAKITAKQADTMKVPVDLLNRLNQLEERDQQFTALQRQENAARGFQTVKDSYGLTQEQLNNFATELVNSGKNPLILDNINIIEQYKTLHFDDILKAEVAKAVAAEQERAAKANQSATTPGKTTGTGGGGGERGKVESVRDLEKFLQENMK
jgi:hypothetical protein